MKKRTVAALGAALALTCAQSAKAQTTYKQLEEYAGVVLAYEITKDTCAGMNSAVIKDRVTQFDSELSTLYGQHWLRAKFEQRGPLQLLLKGNCSLAAVGMLPLSMRLSGDAEFQQAFQRVANNAGPMGQFVGKSNKEIQNLPGEMSKAMEFYASRSPADSAINARPNSAPAKPQPPDRQGSVAAKPVASIEILNFEAMQPFAQQYESCWVLRQENNTRVDCMAAIDPKLRAFNNGSPLSKTTRDYAEKFLENIMFANWYRTAMELKLSWNTHFPDAESLSNACTEMESEGTANRYEVIDCINKDTRPHLVAAREFMHAEIVTRTRKAGGYR